MQVILVMFVLALVLRRIDIDTLPFAVSFSKVKLSLSGPIFSAGTSIIVPSGKVALASESITFASSVHGFNVSESSGFDYRVITFIHSS